MTVKYQYEINTVGLATKVLKVSRQLMSSALTVMVALESQSAMDLCQDLCGL